MSMSTTATYQRKLEQILQRAISAYGLNPGQENDEINYKELEAALQNGRQLLNNREVKP